MTDIASLELRRARWRRALRRAELDTTARGDFAVAGLASRLRAPSVQMLLLPTRKQTGSESTTTCGRGPVISRLVNVEGRNVRLGAQEVPTAHAAALVDSYGTREAWNSYVAIHRSGALECGLGERGASERKDRDDNVIRVFSLISVVARTWALLKFRSALRDRTPVEGPFQLTVGVHRTGDAFLGNVAEGWAEPLSRATSSQLVPTSICSGTSSWRSGQMTRRSARSP